MLYRVQYIVVLSLVCIFVLGIQFRADAWTNPGLKIKFVDYRGNEYSAKELMSELKQFEMGGYPGGRKEFETEEEYKRRYEEAKQIKKNMLYGRYTVKFPPGSIVARRYDIDRKFFRFDLYKNLSTGGNFKLVIRRTTSDVKKVDCDVDTFNYWSRKNGSFIVSMPVDEGKLVRERSSSVHGTLSGVRIKKCLFKKIVLYILINDHNKEPMRITLDDKYWVGEWD